VYQADTAASRRALVDALGGRVTPRTVTVMDAVQSSMSARRAASGSRRVRAQ
jgi:hypothetical protein